MLDTNTIKSAMKRLGLSQSQLAELCDVSKEAVSNWLSGDAMPRPRKVQALAKALKTPIESLFAEPAETEPVVAYRTQRNRAVTGASKEAAEDIARHFRALVPFVQKEKIFRTPVLETPTLEASYIKEAVRQVRSRIGLGATDALTRAHLLELHKDFGSILVPVFWGKEKSGHENALSVLLPDSKTNWVVFSLNSKNDDFNYWLAHELGHCYTLHALRDDAGEAFAEAFAQELLFPIEAADMVLEAATTKEDLSKLVNWYSGNYDVSVVTVIKQLDKAAVVKGKPKTGLDTRAFWSWWSTNRKNVPTVAEKLFKTAAVTTEEYVVRSEELFDTPVFRALAQWQNTEGGRSPAFISAALNIDLGAAVEMSHFLMKLDTQTPVGGTSLNNC